MVKFLTEQHGLSASEASHFEALFYPIHLPKRARFIHAGEICDQVGYLETGILKCVYVRGEQEIVDEFVFPKTLVTCYRSFITSQPARKAIVALSDCRLRIAQKKDIEDLARMHPFVESLSRKMTEMHYLSLHDKLERFRLEDATTRYLRLVQGAPQLVLQLPQYELASYLNISPETLSRIRKRLASKPKFS
ncbi:MAG: Crp/Fnr family transcriptional regulator [Saprospiraceae bacterium]|nr:Crp/Fnr family transcriptional regulator [Saprospiraceae bacterium]